MCERSSVEEERGREEERGTGEVREGEEGEGGGEGMKGELFFSRRESSVEKYSVII